MNIKSIMPEQIFYTKKCFVYCGPEHCNCTEKKDNLWTYESISLELKNEDIKDFSIDKNK